MKEVLIKLRLAYVEFISKERGYTCKGLCHVSLNYLSYTEFRLFQEYLNKYKKTRKVFYNCEGEKTSNKGQFIWPPTNSEVRLKWLDKQIAKL